MGLTPSLTCTSAALSGKWGTSPTFLLGLFWDFEHLFWGIVARVFSYRGLYCLLGGSPWEFPQALGSSLYPLPAAATRTHRTGASEAPEPWVVHVSCPVPTSCFVPPRSPSLALGDR